ncbi:PucR family transcriptional regulator [Nocardiopsis aegyptia]|uniref:PucR family transcriptional regulator n=1 Tax=Nocardiopsis aegyptia TaxID=220378 RepID=A0A7Z0EMV3_9ACTN|nr:helix-turn-helix domain-containing protein [Nocardiopsis aegyptia]NYJ34827.1 hypothetical protein [Nocardiopsis aegyptia]
MSRTRPTLKALIEALDGPVHGLVTAPHGLAGPVHTVTVADENESVPVGALVVARAEGPDAVAVAEHAARCGAGAVAVRGEPDPRLRDLDLAVLSVDPALGADEFAALALSALEVSGTEDRHHDLFSLAQTIATLTGGVVSIEDTANRILAYSASTDGADDVRRQTILGRGCPESFMAHLRAWGVLERVRDGEVVEVAERPDLGAARRLVTGIRAGERMLGSIWVQAADRPLAPTSDQVLLGAARLASVQVMRANSGARVGGPDTGELAVGLLTGAFDTDALARHLGADPATPTAVIALALREQRTDLQWRLAQAAEFTSVYAAAYRHDALVIPACGLLYVLVPAPTGTAPEGWVGELVSVLRENLGASVQAAIAGVAPRMRDVPALKKVGSRMLEVASDRPDQRVCTYEGTRSSVVLHELLESLAARPDLRDDRLDALDDDQHRSLSVYLDSFGDVTAASARLHVHPNTLRHRLRRIGALTGLDLEDPDQRLLAWISLRR